MIRRLDPDDPGFDAAVMLMKIPEQFEFRRRRSDEEDRICAFERARHFFEEMLRVGGMFLGLATPFRVSVDVVLRREDGGFFGRVRVHVKDACFRVIDPDNGMRRHEGMF